MEQEEITEAVARVSNARERYVKARYAHYSIRGNRYDTPGPTRDELSIASRELEGAIQAAQSLAKTIPTRLGVLSVNPERSENAHAEFHSAAELRRKDHSNANWQRWTRSQA